MKKVVLSRAFKGVWIPRDLYLSKDFNWTEKILIAEIDSLDTDPQEGCYASNEYLGQFIGLSEGSVANMISSLRKRKALTYVFFDGKNRGLRSLFHNPDAGKVELIDPERSKVVEETEKLLGFQIDIYTREQIDAFVEERFTDQWLDIVKLRLIGNKNADANYLKTKIGFWLTDYKNNLWRYEKDADNQKRPTSGGTNMPNPAAVTLCDMCKDSSGMVEVTINKVKRMQKCDHKKKTHLKAVG